MNNTKNILNNIDYAGFSLLFIAEGFTAAQEQLFYDHIFKVYNRIADYECFTKLKQDNRRISLLSLYVASANSGTSTSAAGAVGRTLLESYIDGNGLHLNYTKLEALINDSTLMKQGEQQPLAKSLMIYNSDLRSMTRSFILPIIIFPESTMPSGELEFMEDDKFYFVATTLNGWYEQVAIRGMARMVGLGDEFDLNGAANLVPDPEMGETINTQFPNLFYTTTPGSMAGNNGGFKWMGLFPQGATAPITVHPHPSSGSTADRNLPAIPFSYKTIEMWEGGGNYRTKVYRTAVDCIQRRRIGDSSLPVKNTRVSLCPICTFCLEKII